MTIKALRCHSLVYLASAYTLHSEGTEYAYNVAAGILAALAGHGISTYSPIAHWHTASLLDPINKLRHFTPDQWFDLNKPMMALSSCMVVPDDRNEEWRRSVGIHKERIHFIESNKPVYMLDVCGLKITPMTWDQCEALSA